MVEKLKAIEPLYPAHGRSPENPGLPGSVDILVLRSERRVAVENGVLRVTYRPPVVRSQGATR